MKKFLKDNTLLMKEYLYEKNVEYDLNNITEGMNISLWWKCSKCNFEWKTRLSHRTKDGTGCPECRKKESIEKQKQQIRASLMQRGFDSDVISEVMQEIELSKDQEAEWEAIKYHGDRMYRRHSKRSSGFELKQKITSALYARGFKSEQINQFIDEKLTSEE